MVEPYDTVYISKSDSSNRRRSYHRPDRPNSVLKVTTRCGKLQLMDCDAVPEIEAALEHEACLRCFGLRNRRQMILNLIVALGTVPAEADHA